MDDTLENQGNQSYTNPDNRSLHQKIKERIADYREAAHRSNMFADELEKLLDEEAASAPRVLVAGPHRHGGPRPGTRARLTIPPIPEGIIPEELMEFGVDQLGGMSQVQMLSELARVKGGFVNSREAAAVIMKSGLSQARTLATLAGALNQELRKLAQRNPSYCTRLGQSDWQLKVEPEHKTNDDNEVTCA